MRQVHEIGGMIHPGIRKFWSFLLLGMIFLLGNRCTKPIDADFSGSQQIGLADDEMLWIQQIHRSPNPNWLPDATKEDSLRVRTFNLPIFEQVIPELIRDLLAGDLKAYGDYEFTEEEKEIEDLDAILSSLGVSKKDFSAFTSLVEVFSVVKTKKGRYTAQPKYVRIIWQDPEGKVPDRNFATVKVDEIREHRDYPLQVENLRIPFTKYLEFERAVYFPVYVRDNRREYETKYPQESQFLREMVTDGKWAKIDWIEGKINISGRSKINLQPEEIVEFSGVYQFPVEEPDTLGKPKELYLTVERDYLIVDWSHRFTVEKVLPFMENAFFSTTGEIYVFDYVSDTLSGDLYVLTENDTLIGTKIP